MNGTIRGTAHLQGKLRPARETDGFVEGLAEVLSLFDWDEDGGTLSGHAGTGVSRQHEAGGATVVVDRPAYQSQATVTPATGVLPSKSTVHRTLCRTDETSRLHRSSGHCMASEELTLFPPEEIGGFSLEEVIDAYYDCRRHKRNTVNALEFEMDYERHCIDLWHEINEHRYKPRRSIAFIVDRPVKREIFAADFRDRVVHHLVARSIYPLLEQQFHPDSYSTQKGKGTLYGIKRVEQHIKECSENYTKECWVMKLDIKGFFMSIQKTSLFTCVCRFLERRYRRNNLPLLLYLIGETVFNRPEKDCVLKVPRYRWRGLPSNKSLFGTDGRVGIPIGNLTSQLLALLYLDELDHMIICNWEVPHYGRYVDDMVLVHPSKQWLSCHGLQMHPYKMYLQHYSKGVSFIGGVVKPGRKYLSRRVIGRMFCRLHYYNRLMASTSEVPKVMVEHMCATMNSYLGSMCHYNSFRLFMKVVQFTSSSCCRYIYYSHCGRRCKMVARKAVLPARKSL